MLGKQSKTGGYGTNVPVSTLHSKVHSLAGFMSSNSLDFGLKQQPSAEEVCLEQNCSNQNQLDLHGECRITDASKVEEDQ